MRLALVGCAFVLALGCSRDRSEPAPPVAVSPIVSASAANPTGDDPERLCGAKSICPSEPVDDEGTALCASLGRDPTCGKKFLALVKCQIAKEKCGADGKVDQATTMDLCKPEESALQECEQTKAAAAKASAK